LESRSTRPAPAPRSEVRPSGHRSESRSTSGERSQSRAASSPIANHDPALPGVPLLDMQRQYEPLREAIRAAIDRVCESGRFILGPDCEQLEKGIAAYVGVKHGVACASGSDALLLALMAIGIQPRDEVIVPSFTFFATASAVSRLGAVPVFVDIEPQAFNMNPARIEERVTSATKAIIPVHLFGQCADMPAIRAVAAARKIQVVEDAAQAIGAACGDRSAGSMGEIGCFSFYPTKNLGAFGDAGMLTTDDDDLAARLRLLRAHGMEPRYYHKVVGINSRLDSIQAAVLNVKLPHVNRWAQLRRANAEFYTELMTECGLDRILTLPATATGRRHVWNQYVIRVPNGRRDALRAQLSAAKIGTEIYYPVNLHEQECFRSAGYGPGSLPESEQAAREVLALPIFPELRVVEQRAVVTRIAEFFGTAKPASPASVKRPKFLDRQAGARVDKLAS
jgi:dTDP-4-amino-4,6-dideoxygalactose transaminase